MVQNVYTDVGESSKWFHLNDDENFLLSTNDNNIDTTIWPILYRLYNEGYTIVRNEHLWVLLDCSINEPQDSYYMTALTYKLC